MARSHIAGILVAVAALLTSCATFERTPSIGETGGTILVGSPRISGRERLINDRRAQDEWLQTQLNGVDDQRFDVNGLIDTRALAITAAKIQARADPAFDVYRATQQGAADQVRQQNASAVAAEKLRSAAIDQIKAKLDKGEIDAKEAKAQLDSYGVALPSLTAASGTTTPPAFANASTAGTSAASLSSSFVGDVKSNALAPLNPASAATASSVVASPIDLFRDRLALREEIRGEIAENALDDTHDLNRHTLYKFTFDATLLPENDTSAWALVSVTFSPPSQAADIWEPYRDYLEDRFRKEFFDRGNALRSAIDTCAGTNVIQQLRCAIPRTFGSRMQQTALTVLNTLPTTASKVDTRSLSINLLGARVTTRIPTAQSSPLSSAEQAVSRVLASLVVHEFEAERLGCFYRLVANTTPEQDYTTALQLTTMQSYLPRVAPVDFSAEAREARERGCKYGKSPTSVDELATEFNLSISRKAQPRVYAVTPKESVQRLSDVSTRRAASEFLLGLSAIAGSAGVDAMVQHVRENDAFLQAIRRQPLVVGYTQSGAPYVVKKRIAGTDEYQEVRSDELSFGWVLGPLFSITKQNDRPAFRHSVRQQALSATVIAPIWWDTVNMTVKGAWRRENSQLSAFPASPFERTYVVELPRKISALDGIFQSREEREPDVEDIYDTTVQVGERARLLVRGENLWRATEVYLGSQAANRVRLLPDMRGLVAEFDKVLPVWGAANVVSSRNALPISIATSDGFLTIGKAQVASDDARTTRVALGVGLRFFADEISTFTVSPSLGSVKSAEVLARSRASAALNAKIADLAGGLEISRDGGTLRLTPKASDIKLQSGDPLDLILIVGTDSTSGSESVVLANDVTYYQKKDDAQAKLAWATSGSGLRKVKITFPPGSTTAFLSARSGKVDVIPQLLIANKVYPVERKTCGVAKTACVLVIQPPQGVPSEVASAIKAGDFTLDVRLVGEDVPDLAPTSLAGK